MRSFRKLPVPFTFHFSRLTLDVEVLLDANISLACIAEDVRQRVLNVNVEAIDAAIKELRKEGKVEWQSIFSFDELDDVRDRLNQLPGKEALKRDGPFGASGFRYGAKAVKGCRSMSWRLIRFLWKGSRRVNFREEDCWVDIRDIAEPVWEDKETELPRSKYSKVVSDATKFFEKHEFPFYITTDNRRIALLKNKPCQDAIEATHGERAGH